jgi:2-polyprenyl-3-methyl-5-hydroxy-6-metoxy-1,4-benzoquinol methylase
MKTIVHSNCPVCKSTALKPLTSSKDYTVSGEIFFIEVCQNCQTAFTQNMPDGKEIIRYYQSENYISHSNTRKGIINTIYHYVREYMLGKKQQLVNTISKKTTGTALDIGCGTGYFLHTLQQAGWQVQGIEADEKARQFASTQFNLQVSSPEKLQTLATQSFDVITLWHVLEHIHDLDSYMTEIARILKIDGVLVIAVPNYQSADAKHYKEMWAAWDVPRHLWHFSQKSIQTLADRFGFAVTQQHIMPFDSFYVALLSEKYKKNPFALFSGFWQGFLSLLQAWKNVENASSIIYILKNK